MIDSLLRLLVGGVHRLMKAFWFVRRPRTFGAHAIALTPRGRIVLVKLRYAPGWRLPGGGHKQSEDAQDAALRELREEIGLTAHGDVQLACELEDRPDFKRDLASVFIVRDVEYHPKWSLEIESIRETPLHDLPSDVSPRSARWLATVHHLLEQPRPR